MVFKNILLLVGSIFIGSVLLLCLNTFYWGDDYLFMVNIKKSGIIGNCINGYNHWDGRFLSLSSFVQQLGLKYLPVQLITLIWSVSFFASGILTAQIIIQHSVLKKADTKDKMLFTMLFCAIFWLGCYAHVAETMYWATGGAYSFSLLLGVIWYFYFIKTAHGKSHTAICVLLSFIAGASTQNLALPCTVLVLIHICVAILTRKYEHVGFLITVLLALATGLLLISMAPGNAKRLSAVNFDYAQISVRFLINNFISVFKLYWHFSTFLMIFACMGSLATWLIVNPQYKFTYAFSVKIPRSRQTLAAWICNLKWLLAAMSTIVPFVLIPDTVSLRTMLYFSWFMMLFIFELTLKLCAQNTVYTQSLQIKRNNSYIANTFMLGTFVCGIIITSLSFIMGIGLKNTMNQREAVFKKGFHETVKIKIADLDDISFCYQFEDFPLNRQPENSYIYEGAESYYGIKSIIAE